MKHYKCPKPIRYVCILCGVTGTTRVKIKRNRIRIEGIERVGIVAAGRSVDRESACPRERVFGAEEGDGALERKG
jgi:hypothetical protein